MDSTTIREVLSMDEKFSQLSSAVMVHITSLNRGRETRRAYAKCFKGLGEYLQEKEVVYSHEEASLWLSTVRAQVNKTDFSLFTAAINKLNDLYLYGEIQKSHYDPSKTIAGRLLPEFARTLDELAESISDKAEDTVNTHLCQCASIFLRFQNNGITSVSEISYDALLEEYSSSSGKTHYSKCAHHTNLRLLLQFLYDQHRVCYGFTLFVDAMSNTTGDFWNRAEKEQLSELRLLPAENCCCLDDFLAMRDTIYQEHCREKYSLTSLNGFIRITNMFYLFMDINHLHYSPSVSDVWLESVKPSLEKTEYKHFRRILCLLEHQYRKEPFPLTSSFVFRETFYSQLPGWCHPEVDAFLGIKSGEGWAASTIRMYRISICRFCISIDAMGIKAFKDLTPVEVKNFNLSDRHNTPEGKNAYNSRIRKFLQFLGDNHISDNPFLFLALPCVCAKQEALVITLSEEEQAALRRIFQEDDSSISLREKAMIQLGLYMGLRATDIVGLAIDDIDWETAAIRVLQDKTDYEVVLPMPTAVANALFRYIMQERPITDNRSIFIRKHAPFSDVGKGACWHALNQALPGRSIPGSGFHVTRKTYATNLLRNNVPAQHVADALGHRGLETVHKYLSLEEQRMRLCAFSLHDRGLLPEGGICHG